MRMLCQTIRIVKALHNRFHITLQTLTGHVLSFMEALGPNDSNGLCTCCTRLYNKLIFLDDNFNLFQGKIVTFSQCYKQKTKETELWYCVFVLDFFFLLFLDRQWTNMYSKAHNKRGRNTSTQEVYKAHQIKEREKQRHNLLIFPYQNW